MPAYLSPIGNEQQSDASGNPLAGGFIFTYIAGTSTLAATFTDASGAIPQTNPIVLNASGLPASPIYINGGQSMKFIIQNSASVLQRTIDNIQGVNDPSFTNVSDQWIPFNATPTFISANSFSVAGDQTLIFQVGRRVRTTNTGGERYSTILSSAFSLGATTISVQNDSGSLDSGLTNVRYAFLSSLDPSVPSLKSLNAQIAILGFLNPGTITGATTTLTIQPTQAADSTNSAYMSTSSVFTKTTAAWVAGTGNGGSDGVTIPANTTFYAYIIRRPDTGVVDFVLSTNATTPTLTGSLAPYTQFRKLPFIGRTNGSSNISYVLNRPAIQIVGQQEVIGRYSLAGVSVLDMFIPTEFGALKVYTSRVRSPSAADQLLGRLQNNGTAISGANDYVSMFEQNINGTITNSTAVGVSSIACTVGMDNATANEQESVISFGDIYDTAKRVPIDVDYFGVSSGALNARLNSTNSYGGGTSGLAAARNGIRLLSSLGANFTSGDVLILGVAK